MQDLTFKMHFQERFLKLASNTSITPLGAQGPSRPVAIKLSFTRHSSLVPWSWYIIHQVFMELYGYPRTMPRQFRKALLHGLSVYRRSGCQSSSLKHVGLVSYYCSNIPARKFRAGVCICMMYAVPYLHLPSQPTPPSLWPPSRYSYHMYQQCSSSGLPSSSMVNWFLCSLFESFWIVMSFPSILHCITSSSVSWSEHWHISDRARYPAGNEVRGGFDLLHKTLYFHHCVSHSCISSTSLIYKTTKYKHIDACQARPPRNLDTIWCPINGSSAHIIADEEIIWDVIWHRH